MRERRLQKKEKETGNRRKNAGAFVSLVVLLPAVTLPLLANSSAEIRSGCAAFSCCQLAVDAAAAAAVSCAAKGREDLARHFPLHWCALSGRHRKRESNAESDRQTNSLPAANLDKLQAKRLIQLNGNMRAPRSEGGSIYLLAGTSLSPTCMLHYRPKYGGNWLEQQQRQVSVCCSIQRKIEKQ